MGIARKPFCRKGTRLGNTAPRPYGEQGDLPIDDELEWIVVGEEGSEDDGGKLKDGEEEEVEVAREEDPYFARDAAGRRSKRIAEIAEYLPKAEPTPEAS